MGKILGIDLGTTNSAMAVMTAGKAEIIANAEGARTTPSVVAVKSGKENNQEERLVGTIARRQAVTNPQNTVYEVKRLIGRKFEDKQVKKDVDIMPYKIVKSGQGVKVAMGSKQYSPEEISAMILSKLKADARSLSGRGHHRSRHYRSGLFRRFPAPGDQGCRQNSRLGGQAHHQRADGSRFGLRLGKIEENRRKNSRL